MLARTVIRHLTGFLSLVLALLVGAVSPTNADVEAPSTTAAHDEANEPTEEPTKAPPPPRPSSAPT